MVSTIWTVGHGTRPIDDFVALLADAGVRALADIRTFPGSRRHPQFGKAALATSLRAAGIAYEHLPGLGGRRAPREGSPHTALRVDAFRGYADHLATEEFAAEYARLLERARAAPTAVMCAETLWWRCHRRILADRLTVDGWEVIHLVERGKSEPHRLWDVARVADGRIVYDGGAIPLAAE